MNRIAKQILKIAKQLLADTDYIYDPEHKKKPAGGYHKTEKGWSKLEQKKEDKPVKPVNKGLSDKQKKRIDSLSNKERYELANSEEATTEILDYLSIDKDPGVRQQVSYNKNTSTKTLDYLSNDENYGARIGVALNKNTSTKTLDKLSKDERSIVRQFITQNPNISSETLDKLSKDEDSDVRKKAKYRLKKRKQQQSKGNQSKGNQNKGIDFSKMTPELRQKIKDWDIEDIKKFINWLHKHGYKGVIPPEEEQEI